jgi:hypothetical protein
MTQYTCNAAYGYDGQLTEGKIYDGIEEPGIFADAPFLVIDQDDRGEQTVAHLRRFNKVGG